MTLLITELIFGDVQTVSIPKDAIFIISLLIVFALLVYCFNNFLSNDTNQFNLTDDNDYSLELVKETLEDKLTVESTNIDQENVEQPNIKKINNMIASKVFRLGSLVIVGMGGASLLGLQHMQKAYEGMSPSQSNFKLDINLIQSKLSVLKMKILDKSQTKINKISYIDPSLSTIKSSTEKNTYKVKSKQIVNNFSF
tara:strand:+ start:1056 stop:1646 length:591 start_codon:yes stop_codon:yes gene_type:complete